MHWNSKDWRIKAVSEDESVVKSAEKKKACKEILNK